MSMKHYIYLHKRKDTGEVFYVGKGEGNRYKSKVGRTAYWLNIVKKHGYIAEIVEYFDSECLAFSAEQKLIAKIGRKDLGKGPLVNLSDGGEGASGAVRTLEQKATYSRTTWMRTEAGKASVSGEKNPAKKPETRKKLSENNAHRNPEVRAKGAATFRALGENHPSKSEAHRKLMRERNPASRPDVRKKISESKKGIPSPNKGQKVGPMSESQKKLISIRTKEAKDAKKARGEKLVSEDGIRKIQLAARERSIKLSKGIYVTPKGKFILLIEAANANEVSSKTISKNCLGYVRNGKKYLPKLGWSFTPKN
jgi:hypothetical protein